MITRGVGFEAGGWCMLHTSVRTKQFLQTFLSIFNCMATPTKFNFTIFITKIALILYVQHVKLQLVPIQSGSDRIGLCVCVMCVCLWKNYTRFYSPHVTCDVQCALSSSFQCSDASANIYRCQHKLFKRCTFRMPSILIWMFGAQFIRTTTIQHRIEK